MIWIVLSVLCSAVIYVIFKLFGRLKVNTLVAIVSNYAMACSIGILLAPNEAELFTENTTWWWLLPILGALFIGLFQLMARVSMEAGVGVAALANKMSLVIPVAAAFIVLGDALTLLKLLGVAAALVSVWLVTSSERGQRSHRMWPVWVLFAGSGLLDTLLKWAEHKWVPDDQLTLFTASIFGSAGALGIIWVVLQREKWNTRSVVAGFLLGIPNYGSIYFLLKALSSPEWQSSVLFPINNVAVVLLSSGLGMLAFAESTGTKKWIGLALGVLAVSILAYA